MLARASREAAFCFYSSRSVLLSRGREKDENPWRDAAFSPVPWSLLSLKDVKHCCLLRSISEMFFLLEIIAMARCEHSALTISAVDTIRLQIL